jgi:hypothetical protein
MWVRHTANNAKNNTKSNHTECFCYCYAITAALWHRKPESHNMSETAAVLREVIKMTLQ